MLLVTKVEKILCLAADTLDWFSCDDRERHLLLLLMRVNFMSSQYPQAVTKAMTSAWEAHSKGNTLFGSSERSVYTMLGGGPSETSDEKNAGCDQRSCPPTGGAPHLSSQSESVYRSTRTGPGNIPHTSYSHTTASTDSDRPYRNNVSSFSYNV